MFLEKAIDLIIDTLLKFFVYVIKIIYPIKIRPKEVKKGEIDDNWKNIYSLKIENRLNSELYDVFIAGISKEAFSIKIISDDSAKGKTVEYMNINTNHFVALVTDKKTGNHLWIFRIHKLSPKEVLSLRLKIENKENIYFKTLQYSPVEVPIKERKDGVVAIPFDIEKISKKIPKIK